jgi:uncharacterized damage-inducible protein DinB
MKADEIKLLFEYNFWANQRILAACSKLSEAQYTAVTLFGCLRPTLIHILDGEVGWRSIFQAAQNFQFDTITEASLPTFAELATRWATEQQTLRTYLDSLTDEQVSGIIRYPIDNGLIRERPLWHCLLHLINHGTQHRSEAAAMLTSFQHSPGELDVTVFLNEYFHLPG